MYVSTQIGETIFKINVIRISRYSFSSVRCSNIEREIGKRDRLRQFVDRQTKQGWNSFGHSRKTSRRIQGTVWGSMMRNIIMA